MLTRGVVAGTMLLCGFVVDFAVAQDAWEVTSGIGYYVPLATVVSAEDDGSSGQIARRHVGAILGGVRLGRSTDWIRLEMGLDYTPSLVAVSSSEETRDLSSGLLLGHVRALLALSHEGTDGRWSLFAGPGLGVVHRWGAAWDSFSGKTSPSGSAAFVARYAPETYPVAFRIEVDGHVYRTRLRDDPDDVVSQIHGELLWIVGVSVPVNL